MTRAVSFENARAVKDRDDSHPFKQRRSRPSQLQAAVDTR